MTNDGNFGPIYPATPTFGGSDVIFLIFEDRMTQRHSETSMDRIQLQAAHSEFHAARFRLRLLGYFRSQTTLILGYARTQVD
jgi:hypothetical protein